MNSLSSRSHHPAVCAPPTRLDPLVANDGKGSVASVAAAPGARASDTESEALLRSTRGEAQAVAAVEEEGPGPALRTRTVAVAVGEPGRKRPRDEAELPAAKRADRGRATAPGLAPAAAAMAAASLGEIMKAHLTALKLEREAIGQALASGLGAFTGPHAMASSQATEAINERAAMLARAWGDFMGGWLRLFDGARGHRRQAYWDAMQLVDTCSRSELHVVQTWPAGDSRDSLLPTLTECARAGDAYFPDPPSALRS